MKVCRTVLLSDNPAEKDEFGSHQKVADAIFDLINSERDGGKTIGLEGQWGIGKSTIINLLHEKLISDREKNNNLVVIFDAWAHRDDPLRRTFLESVIYTALEKKDWIDNKKWTQILNIISQRLKIETKNVHTGLKPWARVLIIGSLMVPISSILLNTYLNINGIQTKSLLFWLLLFFTINPLFILIINMLCEKNNSKHKEISDLDYSLSFLFQKSITDNKTETFQTSNPTSIEFEEKFSELIKDIAKNSSHRVILILDNLDRIEPDDALSLLSTLQTYFQYQNKKSGIPNIVWAIIPYDKNGLLRVWAYKNINPKKITNNKDSVDEETNTNYAVSFIDKKFQIIFEVPPLLLSNWSEYLKKSLLKKAFPDHSDSDLHQVYRVFDLYRPNRNQIPTPRELILYVNQIGALHRQWQDTYPLSHYGFYTLLKKANEPIESNIKAKKYIDSQIQALLGNNIENSLISLVYNVDYAYAQQILITQELDIILGEGNIDRFIEISKNTGFEQYLETIPFPERIDNEARWLCNAGHVIFESKILEHISSESRDTIITELKRALLNSHLWIPLDKELANGLINIVSITNPSEQILIKIINSLSASVVGGKEIAIDALHPWIDGVVHLLNSFKSLISADTYDNIKINIPTSASDYLDACSYIFKTNDYRKFASIFTPTSKKEEILAIINNLIKGDKYHESQYRAVYIMKYQTNGFNWDSVIQEIITRFHTVAELSAESLISILATLWFIRGFDHQIDASLRDISQQGYIFHHLNSVVNNPKAIAYSMLTFLHSFPDFRNVTEIGNSDSGKKHISDIFKNPTVHTEVNKIFAELIGEHSLYDLPFRILDGAVARGWIIEIFKLIVDLNFSSSVFTKDAVIKYWDFITSSFDRTFIDKIMEQLIIYTDIANYIIDTGFNINQASLYASLIRAGLSKDTLFINWCEEYLIKINMSEIYTHLCKEDGIVELLIELGKSNFPVQFSTTYQDIIFQHSQGVYTGQIQISKFIDSWKYLFTHLPKHSHETLQKRIIDLLKTPNTNIPSAFFDSYGNDLLLISKIENFPEFVRTFFTPIITNRNLRGLSWISDFIDGHINLLRKNSSSPEVIDFYERISESINNTEDTQEKELLVSIQTKLRKNK